MLNKMSMNNRRMIMSAKMLHAYQQDKDNKNQGGQGANEHSSQNSDALPECDDNAIYELGYN
jgi:hypothetical protein